LPAIVRSLDEQLPGVDISGAHSNPSSSDHTRSVDALFLSDWRQGVAGQLIDFQGNYASTSPACFSAQRFTTLGESSTDWVTPGGSYPGVTAFDAAHQQFFIDSSQRADDRDALPAARASHDEPAASAVEFLIAGPPTLSLGAPAVFLAWAFLAKDREEARRRAQDEFAPGRARLWWQSGTAIPRGSRIPIRLQLFDKEQVVGEAASEIRWDGGIANASLLIEAPSVIRSKACGSLVTFHLPTAGLVTRHLQLPVRPSTPEIPCAASSEGWQAFISYRRDGGDVLARLLRTELGNRGVRAFLDVEDLGRREFDPQLLGAIEKTPYFIPILSPGSLDRCTGEGDWFRREIAHALATRRIIIPLICEGTAFPSENSLPADIAPLARMQAVHYSHYHFRDTMGRLLGYLRSDE
jgi:hypothetical protein